MGNQYEPHKDKRDYLEVEIFRCPSYPDKRQTVCYVINGCYLEDDNDRVGQEWNMANFGKCKLPSYKRLHETIYLTDHAYLNGTRPIIEDADNPQLALCDVMEAPDLPYEITVCGEVARLNPARRISAERHRMGVNVLYADWHVGWIQSEAMDIDIFRFHTR